MAPAFADMTTLRPRRRNTNSVSSYARRSSSSKPSGAANAAALASSTTSSAPGASQPPSRSEASAFSASSLAIGRIEKHQRERLHRMRRAEIGGVAAIDFRDAAEPQRLDIVAQQRAGLGAVVDEQRERRAARNRLDAERAGAGEQVEHARALDRIVIGMDQDVEQRLAQPVRGRPDVARGRRRPDCGPSIVRRRRASARSRWWPLRARCVPSPVGEGLGVGVPRPQTSRGVPLSPTLPRKGGGNGETSCARSKQSKTTSDASLSHSTRPAA